MRTFVATIERLRGYISVCKHLRDGRDIIYYVQQYVATAVPVVLIYLSAENKMWEQYPFLQIALFLNMFFTLAQYRSFHSALRDVREVFHSSMR